jgi:hypothetical protein
VAQATQNPAAAAARLNTATVNPAQIILNREARNAKSIKGEDPKRSPLVKDKKHVESAFSNQPKKAKGKSQGEGEEEKEGADSSADQGDSHLDVMA